MITISEALAILDQHIEPLAPRDLPLRQAGGLVLAQDIPAPISMPPFRQSSMDGYAICRHQNQTYRLVGEVKAGPADDIPLQPGEAVRIFTGARVPDDADTVVIQEHVEHSDDSITIGKLPESGANIRLIGEQVQRGQTVLRTGSILNAAAIGFLAGMGMTSVPVFPRPQVSLLVTGDELALPGSSLEAGEVYESNSLMLSEALRPLGIPDLNVIRVKDSLEATKEAIREALDASDILMISGGISVGDYDFVEESLHHNEVEPLFYKVRQKPGKPLWFGKKGKRFVFALPGNPASGFTSFLLYVRPMIMGMMGHTEVHLPRKQAILTQAIRNKSGRALLMKARVSHGLATPLTGQASSMLNTYAISNGLILIPEDMVELPVGHRVQVVDLKEQGA